MTASGDRTFKYDRTFNCSKLPSDYTNLGDSATYGNTATITETRLSADASVRVYCYIPAISKTGGWHLRVCPVLIPGHSDFLCVGVVEHRLDAGNGLMALGVDRRTALARGRPLGGHPFG